MFRMLLILMLVLSVSLAFGQGGKWEFDKAVVVGWASATDAGEAGINLPGFKNPYSVTVDPDGNVWCAAYYQRYFNAADGVTRIWPDDIEKTIKGSMGQDSVIVVGTYPIFIMNTEGVYDSLLYLTLPDQSVDTLLNSHRGMGTLPDGNIIATLSNGTVYKINYQTHEIMDKTVVVGGGGRPGIDAEGFVYQMDGVFATKIDILDPSDFSVYNSITGISAGVTRCMEVSPDGKNVYLASQSGGAHHYYSAEGVDGTYAIVDTILRTVMVDTSEMTTSTNLVQWHPSGLLWLATYEDTKPTFMYALDPDQDYMVVDSLKDILWWGNTDKMDTTSANYPKPQYLRCVRDAFISADGNDFYAVDFYGYTVKKFKFTPGTSIQPDKDSKTVPDVFTLYRNYPNPFNPTTVIPFDLHKKALVQLRIYDSLGRSVGTVINKEMNAGSHEYEFNAANLASGTYYFKLTVDTKVATGKMVLVK